MRGSKYKDSQSDLKSIEKLNRVMQARRLQNLRTDKLNGEIEFNTLPTEGRARRRGEPRGEGLFEKTKTICETNDDPTAEINCAFITGLFCCCSDWEILCMMRVYKMTDHRSFV